MHTHTHTHGDEQVQSRGSDLRNRDMRADDKSRTELKCVAPALIRPGVDGASERASARAHDRHEDSLPAHALACLCVCVSVYVRSDRARHVASSRACKRLPVVRIHILCVRARLGRPLAASQVSYMYSRILHTYARIARTSVCYSTYSNAVHAFIFIFITIACVLRCV